MVAVNYSSGGRGRISPAPFPTPVPALVAPFFPASSIPFAAWPFRPSSFPPPPEASGAEAPSDSGRAPFSDGVRASVSRPSGRIASVLSWVGLRVEKRSNCWSNSTWLRREAMMFLRSYFRRPIHGRKSSSMLTPRTLARKKQ